MVVTRADGAEIENEHSSRHILDSCSFWSP